jgi:teichuronic acid biosynthesis glycosyltransferase TuaC
MPINKITIITDHYPSAVTPDRGTFVEQFVTAIARLGVSCTVINPVKIHIRGETSPRIQRIIEYENSTHVKVYHPRYIPCSNKTIGPLPTALITQFTFERSVKKVLDALNETPDVFYGHFLYPGGKAAVTMGKVRNVNSFVAFGESINKEEEKIWSTASRSTDMIKKDFQKVAGIVAVSKLNQKKIIKELKISESKVLVLPNGVNSKLFFPRDRASMREKFNIPQDKFVVAYVGRFNDRKGVMRVGKALEGIDDIGAVYIGSGPLLPETKVLFRGTLSHKVIPEMLSAANIFVLPTIAEGSCNSIIEAMACGLPIVSSLGDFNDDILDEKVAFRVDPNDISAIRNSILRLKFDTKLRMGMSTEAIKKSKSLDINHRAKKTIIWMEEMTKKASGNSKLGLPVLE